MPDSGDARAAALARHAVALATVRDFGRRSRAERVVALVDSGDGRRASMIEWQPDAPLELTEGETTWTVPEEAAAAAPPLALAPLRPAPASAIRVDAITGEIAAPIGAIEHLADAVLDLARAFGGRSVASADFATDDPDAPFTLAARPGEPVVVGIGDDEFELPGGAG